MPIAITIFFSVCSANASPMYSRAGDVADCPDFIVTEGKKTCPFVADWRKRVKDVSKVEGKCMRYDAEKDKMSLRTLFGILNDTIKYRPVFYEESGDTGCPSTGKVWYTTIENIKEPTEERPVAAKPAAGSAVSPQDFADPQMDSARYFLNRRFAGEVREQKALTRQWPEAVNASVTAQEAATGVPEEKDPQNLFLSDKKLKLPRKRPLIRQAMHGPLARVHRTRPSRAPAQVNVGQMQQ